MFRLVISTITLAAALGGFARLEAQDEARLRRALEGKRVTVLLDLPASQEGVDLFPGTGRPLDFQKYSGQIKKYGAAIKDGERSIITKVRVKDEVVEIHLGGGGYGTFGDKFGSIFSNKGADSGAAQQARIANEHSQRQAAGSRFNLRYPNGVTPEDLELDRVVAVLAEYMTISAPVGSPVATKSQETAPQPLQQSEKAEPKKGMSVQDVERDWGKATASAENGSIQTRTYSASGMTLDIDFFNGVAVDIRKRGSASGVGIRKGMTSAEVEALAGKSFESKVNGSVTTSKYRWQEGVLEADFYNGVLVGYRISSN